MEAEMTIVIGLHNSDLGDLFVSVVDLNQAGSPTVLQNQRINENDSFQVAVQEDGSGNGSIQWTVQRADDASQTAQQTVQVSSGLQIDVST
jgi:hypothetical protein